MPLPSEEVKLGSVVVVRSRADNLLYRARVVELETSPGVAWIGCVRYIDYGNKEDRVLGADIYRCDPEFLLVPAQAVLCQFHGVTEVPGSLTQEDTAMFKDLMKKSGPFQLMVTRRLHQHVPFTPV